MSNLYENLKIIYSNYQADKVISSPEYQKLESENTENTIFSEYSLSLKRMRASIDLRIGSAKTESSQLENAIFLLNIMGDRQEDCFFLIKNSYYKNWSPENQILFDNHEPGSFLDYFLSFTNKNNSVDSVNCINQIHRNLIIHYLGNKKYENDCCTKNLLAEVLNKILKDAGFNGFFYPEHEQNNEIVDDKLRKACKESNAFIQLIENKMFCFGDIDNNYCFTEYEIVCNTIEIDQRIYILSESRKNLEKFQVNYKWEYDLWFREVMEKDPIFIESTEKYNENTIVDVANHIKVKLCEKIAEIKKKQLSTISA